MDVSDLTVDRLGKPVIVQDPVDGNRGYLLGRLREIRHRLGEDGGTPETPIKVELFGREEGVVVAVTLGPGTRISAP
jgi:hypothetical protein